MRVGRAYNLEGSSASRAQESRRRQHADATVGQLALAVPVHLDLTLALEEASRVKVELRAAEGISIARQPICK